MRQSRRFTAMTIKLTIEPHEVASTDTRELRDSELDAIAGGGTKWDRLSPAQQAELEHKALTQQH
jgi:hypothetical protein